MKRTREIGGKILKYAEERLQDSNFSTEKIRKNTEKIRKYARNISDVSKELMQSSVLMAGHKKIFVDPSPDA